MRYVWLVLVVLSSACATTPVRPAANIPAIRHQIDEAIAADPGLVRRTADFTYEAAKGAAPADVTAQLPATRRVTAMGKVTPETAVVYTRPGAIKLEETWVHAPDGWKLAHVIELDEAPAPTAQR